MEQRVKHLEQIQETDAEGGPGRGATLAFVALGGACVLFAVLALNGRGSKPDVKKSDPLGELVSQRVKAEKAKGGGSKPTDLAPSDVTFPGILSDDTAPPTALAAVKGNPQARDPLADLDARVARLRRLRGASLALPLVAMSLLGPLTLHFPFAATADVSARDYGEWIQLSGMIVGIAHLVLAGMSVRYVSRLLAAQDTGVPLVLHREWMFALGIVVVASCLPGIVFLAIPPVLTAVTGVVLVPMMFHWAHAALRDEARATDAARAARDSAAEPSAPAYEAGPPPSDTAPPVFGRTASA